MLEPQSTGLFLVLIVVFCALLYWLAVTRQTVFRVLAACLAFIPAMLFGVAAVNKYYDYYQTWGSAAADLGGQGANQGPALPAIDAASGQKLGAILGSSINVQAAAQKGQTFRLTVHGRSSHLTRHVYVYLPPQYFRQAYSNYRFPAIELINGFPGGPQDWINVVGITAAYTTLLNDGVVKPAALIMPDSEGGHCAANLALIYRLTYGYAGVLSGYFAPYDDQLGDPPRLISPFGGSAALRAENTPSERLPSLPVSARIPQFWLGVGGLDSSGLAEARSFQRLLLARQPGVQLQVEPGGGHTMPTWRALMPPMLEWMTPKLSAAAQHPVRTGLTAVVRHRGRAPGRAARTADGAPHRAPGAGRPRDTAPPAT